jgi:hypothetical protein
MRSWHGGAHRESSANNLRQTARSHSAGAASSPKLSADAPPPCSDCARPRLRPRRLLSCRALLRRLRPLLSQLADAHRVCSRRLICGHTLRPEQLLIDANRCSCLLAPLESFSCFEMDIYGSPHCAAKIQLMPQLRVIENKIAMPHASLWKRKEDNYMHDVGWLVCYFIQRWPLHCSN